MKGLPNLIRLHRWRLDEKRKNLGGLERLAADLREQGHRIENELKGEQMAAGASREAGYAYGAYAKTVIARRARLAASLAEAKAKIAQAADEVTESFQELKRLEIAQGNRERAARDKAAKSERLILDELGLNAHRRGGRS